MLVLEICATRLVSPYFGSTIYVWSASISVTLAALAGGYAAGGFLADGRRVWEALAGVFSAAALWLFFVPLAKDAVLPAVSALGVAWGALAAVGLLMGLPLFLLGASAPMTMRLATADFSGFGRGVGGVAAVSTAGSVLGALSAGFWLAPVLPTSRLLWACAVLLSFLAAYCVRRGKVDRRAVGTGGAAVLCAALLSASAPAGALREGVLREHVHGYYGDIKVVDRPGWRKRFLYVDGISNTVADLETLASVSDYISGLELSAWMRRGEGRALLLGLGGGALVGRFARHGIVTDVLDVDPAMEPIARRYFGFKPTGGVFLEDGRRYLERGGRAYDLIVYDAFTGDRHPSHLFTVEGLLAAKRRLAPGGVAAFNVIGYARGPRAGLKSGFERTLGRVFRNVRVLAANRGLDLDRSYVNLIFYASDGSLDIAADPAGNGKLAAYLDEIKENFLETKTAPDGTVFTDDFNPIEVLSAPAFFALRRDILGYNREVLAYGL